MAGERIGILGGSFNPVHLGHLITAQSAIESFKLDMVFFMPCNIQPLKGGRGRIDSEHRLAMVELAISDNLKFDLLDIEIARGGTSYAIDSVRKIRAMCPTSELFFIIGTDTLRELHLWRDIYQLLDLCGFVTLARPGYDLGGDDALKLRSPWREALLKNTVAGRMIDISSSDIRHRVAEGMSIRYLVPCSVEEYIYKNGLYSALEC